VSVWFSLGIRTDPRGSAWTRKARNQVKLSSTPCSESARIHTDSMSFRVIPHGSARNTWGRVKTSLLVTILMKDDLVKLAVEVLETGGIPPIK
jgi:hypothetical protein